MATRPCVPLGGTAILSGNLRPSPPAPEGTHTLGGGNKKEGGGAGRILYRMCVCYVVYIYIYMIVLCCLFVALLVEKMTTLRGGTCSSYAAAPQPHPLYMATSCTFLLPLG